MFRNVIADLRDLIEVEDSADGFKMVRGFVESDATLARLQAISIPVRRSYMPTDPINFDKMCAILESCDSEVVRAQVAKIKARYEVIQQELDSGSILDETRVLHSEILNAWLDAALYKDFGDRGKKFNDMVNRFGKTVEGIAWHLTERMAERILELDEAARVALGDPATHGRRRFTFAAAGRRCSDHGSIRCSVGHVLANGHWIPIGPHPPSRRCWM